MKITDFVTKENTARFIYLRNMVAYYTIFNVNDSHAYMFPIPLQDIGNATLNLEEKSILVMRYIRKAIDTSEIVRINK